MTSLQSYWILTDITLFFLNSNPYISVKLKRNTVTQDELNQIANVLNVKYEQYFVLANGDQVR